MKKLFALFLCLLLSVAVSACESVPESTSDDPSPIDNFGFDTSHDVLYNPYDYWAIKMFASFSDLQAFYSTFKERNDFSFVFPNLDGYDEGYVFYGFRGIKEGSEYEEFGFNGQFNTFEFFAFVSQKNDTSIYERLFTVTVSHLFSCDIENFNADKITINKEVTIPVTDSLQYLFGYDTGDLSKSLISIRFNNSIESVNESYAEKTTEQIKARLIYIKNKF